MSEKVINISRKGKKPKEGDYIRTTFNSGVVLEHQFHDPEDPIPDEEIARSVRNLFLAQTDYTPEDHSKRNDIIKWRKALREWPQNKDGGFPDLEKIPTDPR